MSSPSSAKILASSSRVGVRNTKRDVNPSRSKAIGASSVSNSSRSVAGTGATNTRSARVYLDGVDVTPQSLLVSRIKPSTPGAPHIQGQRGARTGKLRVGNRSKGSNPGQSSAVAGASVIFSSASVASTDNDSDGEPSSSSVGGSGGSTHKTKPAPQPSRGKEGKTGAGGTNNATSAVSSAPHPSPSSNQEDDDNNQADGEGIEGGVPKAAAVGFEDDAGGANSPTDGEILSIAKTTSASGISSAMAAVLLDAKTRRRPLGVTLQETPTEIILELRSVCVAQDTPAHAAINARNKRYVEMCAQKKGSDKYKDGRSQTLQLAQKAKEVMTAPPATRDAATIATDWDIFDCARLEEEANNNRAEDVNGDITTTSATTSAAASTEAGQSSDAQQQQRSNRTSTGVGTDEFGDAQLKHQVEEIVGATMASPGCVLDVDGDIVEDLRARQHHASRSRRPRPTGVHGNSGSSGQFSRSRAGVGGSTAHALDMGRSTANANVSSSSAASPGQSGANVSFGASQDAVGGHDDGASSSSAVATSSAQIPTQNQSRAALSGDNSSDDRQPNAYARANTNVDIGEIIARQRMAKVLASTSLLRTASIVERAVQQNVYHQQHVRYRDMPILGIEGDDSTTRVSAATDARRIGSVRGGNMMPGDMTTIGTPSIHHVIPAFSSGFPTSATSAQADGMSGGASTRLQAANLSGPMLERLWAFRCKLAEGRSVSCLAWNSVNDDLLAVSYARSSLRSMANDGNLSGDSIMATSSSTSPPSFALSSPGNTTAANSSATNNSNAAAATGSEFSSSADEGLVLFWSLKNPEYPERIYSFPVGVTSIDFSHSHPYLLAVGFADGVVAIYDTRRDDSSSSALTPSTGPSMPATPSTNQRPSSASSVTGQSQPSKHVPVPVATSELSTGKHLEAVWQIRWLSKGVDRAENVVSISSDGRVTEWSLTKGLSFSDLMTLKRVPNPLLGRAASSSSDGPDTTAGVLSRQASGQCIDFCPTDASVYYVGTEDGLIHKCSASYNEQYLQTYAGHAGPVYQLAVSPFCPDLLISCSGDWTIKLWHEREASELLSFRSVGLQHAVLGVSWSPRDAAVFAAVAEDGRVEIWDLVESILDPVVAHFPKKYVMKPVATNPAENNLGGSGAIGNDEDDLLGGITSANRASGDDPDGDASAATPPAIVAPKMEKQEVPLECTTVAFAPVAPVLVVGDSTGDVTVYRVPAMRGRWAQQDISAAGGSPEEQVAQLLRAIRPNNPA